MLSLIFEMKFSPTTPLCLRQITTFVVAFSTRSYMTVSSLDTYTDVLPIGQVAQDVNDALQSHPAVVITAPPGAGKSTLLPLTIHRWLAGDKSKVVLLEPRRVAARQIAERMAQMTGTAVGDLVGYRVRFESKVSAHTGIEVLTEGILTRMMVADPTLDGISVIIFDEFHERGIITDTALALARETQHTIRPDLKIVVMSATIDATAICQALKAPLIESQGRMFDVDVQYGDEATAHNCAEVVAATVCRAWRETEGSMLAFLPGEAEIARCAEMLEGAFPATTTVYPLYGRLSAQEQREAIAPPKNGERKIVLATPIAETSITIEGVTVVVDSGFCRKMVYDPRCALEHLETVRISMDMAHQRTGRAGRVAPGRCYRLWSKAAEARMPECREPEITTADLTSLVLDVAAWGGGDTERLPWLTPPPAGNVRRAGDLLESLGAVDGKHRITPHGEALAKLPCHPRIAQMLVRADSNARKTLAADVAALLEERDPLSDENDADINTRIVELRKARQRRPTGKWRRIALIAEQYRRMIGAKEDNSDLPPCETGMLIASAYPERVAMLQSDGSYKLANGERATLDPADDLHACNLLAVATVDRKIRLASAVDKDGISPLAKAHERVAWDSTLGRVAAMREWRIGRIVLSAKPLESVPREITESIVAQAVKSEGRSLLNLTDNFHGLQRRIAVCSAWHPELALPDVSTDALLKTADEWLPMYSGGAVTAAGLKKIDMAEVLWAQLSYEQQREVDRIAPSHVAVPTGSRIRIDYRKGSDAPVVSVRLQECFGMTDTPCVDNGTRPLLMELLSPGFKPVQLTKDLRSFWSNAYFEVRKELRRRYPKHYWPDNPLEAQAVRGVKRNIGVR